MKNHNKFEEKESANGGTVIGGFAQITGVYNGALRLKAVENSFSKNPPDYIIERPDRCADGSVIWAQTGTARNKVSKKDAKNKYIQLRLDIVEKDMQIWPVLLGDAKKGWDLVYNATPKPVAKKSGDIQDEIVF